MTELVEILIQAIDEASDTFQSIVGSADDAASSLEDMSSSVEDIPTDAIEETAQAVDDVEQEANETTDALGNINSVIEGMVGVEVFSSMSDALMDLADKAGNFQDSITRASLAADGAGISVNDMTDTVSKLSSETGRAGGQMREAFITATASGITSTESFTKMMEGASAQAFILGTDVNSLASKLSGMTMKSSIAEKTLKGTGITVEELGEAMGMQGATIDEINAKWETMDANQRAAILGTAASMNEGEDANETYKNSWAGLHEQIDIAKGRIERLVGSVLLPVLIPAMKAAANILDWVGGVIDSVMSGPLGGLVSAIGAVAAGIALAIPAIMAIQAGISLFTATIWPAVMASWALIAPWLPFIAIGAAVVYIIYEIGKAFGWWSDAGEMIDAISAGLQRMWNAFINHPDVQAALQALGDAFNFLMEAGTNTVGVLLEFFDVGTSGDFDIVRALIDGIGNAWNNVRPAIMFVIDTFRQVIDIINQFRTGQIDLPTFIFSILQTMANFYSTIFNTIIGYVVSFASNIISKGISAARNFVNGIVSYVSQLPGKVYAKLVAVVSRIVSAGAQWVSSAKQKASELVSGAVSTISSLPGKISSALAGVVDAVVAPFRDAYNQAKGWWDKITNLNLSAGGDFNAAGGTDIYETGGTDYLEITINHNLENLPDGLSAEDVAYYLNEAVLNDSFVRAIAESRSFQKYDTRMKGVLTGKNNRSLGV